MRIFALLVFFSAASAYAGPPKACSLITPEQAQTILGGKVPAGQRANSGPQSKCGFSDPNQSKDLIVSYLAISALNLPNPQMAVQMMKQGNGVNAVEGLGEFATYAVNPGVYDVVVLFHGYMIGLQYHGPQTPDPRDAMLALARQVMGKF